MPCYRIPHPLTLVSESPLPRACPRANYATEERIFAALSRRRAEAAEDDWYALIHAPCLGGNKTLAEWTHIFVTDGLVPFMRAHGLELNSSRPLAIEHAILYFIHTGCMVTPPPKHRDLEKYRWIYRHAIGQYEWVALLERWSVNGGLFDEKCAPVFADVVYAHLDPDGSRILRDDDERERKARDDDVRMRSEQEHGSWAWLKSGGAD